ncbi:formylmethanofuran dehydrogenase [Paraburkholderia sp.]|uniref:formylmethanofuran dehydrogenase n=1 Tax=Paraburkholderia sp. TaxID=1926495 RepID=UPI003D6F88E8
MSLSSIDPSNANPSSAAGLPVRSTARDWVCPFCPLLCDDLVVHTHADDTLSAPDTDCARLAHALSTYRATDASCRCIVDGSDMDLDTALARGAQIVSDAHRPLFGGLATDVAGTRALYTLAAGCGAILDHLHGDALSAATLALQDRGSFFTTLSEVRDRADLLVFFHCRPSLRYPRFFARVDGDEASARELIFVGTEPDPAASMHAHARIGTVLPDTDPYDSLALWSALSEGRRADTLPHADADIVAALAALHTRIVAAPYAVIVYEPAALPGPHAALLIEALNRIVKAENRTSRAACFALGGDDGALTVNQTTTWLSGLPLRTRVAMPSRLAGTAPLDHDPYRYRTDTLIARGEIDALLWVASFAPDAWPEALDRRVPIVVLGHPALADAAKARGAGTVFIPVATPGIDSGGHLFRVDSSVVMPLAAARGVSLPSVATIAAQLSARLPATFAASGTDANEATGEATR